MAMPEEDMMDMEDEGSPDEDFQEALAVAFPDVAADPDRAAALKDAIRACVRKDMEGGYGGGEPPPSKGKGGGLALIFGPAKKGK